LIISCKGIKNGRTVEKCSFLYDGNWGDETLIIHQKFHESNLSKNTFWLGFDSYLPFGKFSERDGKHS